MNYINKNAQEATLYIPANGYELSVDTTLAVDIYNTTDKGVENLQIDSAEEAGYLLAVRVSVPEGLRCGEWQYRVHEVMGAELATGLLVVYDGARTSPTQYEDELNIIQYGG